MIGWFRRPYRFAWPVALALSAWVAPAQSGDGFAQASRQAARVLPPEPLSRWASIDNEVERLVVTGELPFEARSFRPNDRGDLSAWLAQTTPARSSHSRARLQKLLAREIAQLSPASRGDSDLPRAGSRLSFGDREERLNITPYLRVMPVFETGRKGGWTPDSRLGFRAHVALGSKVAVSTGLFAAEIEEAHRFADPLIADTDWVLHEEEATLTVRWGPLKVRAGRDRHQWGNGASGTLLLSQSGEPVNFVEYQFRIADDLRFLALNAVSGSMGADSASSGRRRYLAAHRLQWNVTRTLAFGFSEGARYENTGDHWLYLAGIVPYTLVERLDIQDESNAAVDDRLRNNVLWSVDAAWRFLANAMFYAEVLADDVAAESGETPTRGGFQAGVTFAPGWVGCDWLIGAEYTRVSDYTYSVHYQDLCRCDWEHQGLPLGYALGPDVENVLLRAVVDPLREWQFEGWLRHVRKGEGRIGRPWRPLSTGCSDCEPDCGHVDAWALSQNVTRTAAAGVSARYRPGPLFWTGASIELWRTSGADGGGDADGDRDDDDKTGATARLFVSVGAF